MNQDKKIIKIAVLLLTALLGVLAIYGIYMLMNNIVKLAVYERSDAVIVACEPANKQRIGFGDFIQPGIDLAFERGTSVTPTLETFPSGPPTFLGIPFPNLDGSDFGGFPDNLDTQTRLGDGCFFPGGNDGFDGFGWYSGGAPVCITRRAQFEPANGIAPHKLCSAEIEFAETGLSDSPVARSVRRDGNIITVFMKMSNRMSLTAREFDVDWEFNIEFDISNPSQITYKILSGRHDQFPLYEVFIGDQLVYGYNGFEAVSGATNNIGIGYGGVDTSLLLSNRQLGEPGLMVQPPFEGMLNSESRIFDICLSSNQGSLPSFCR